MVERTTLGLNRSTLSADKITPLTPAPSALRSMVPRFPGSCKCSRRSNSGAFFPPPKICSSVYPGCFKTASTPCGDCVSDILAKTSSLTTSGFTGSKKTRFSSFLFIGERNSPSPFLPRTGGTRCLSPSILRAKEAETKSWTTEADGASVIILMPSTTKTPSVLRFFPLFKYWITRCTCAL